MQGAHCLDIECGDKPYAELTSGLVHNHVGVDHEETSHDKSRVDIFGTAYRIPVQDELPGVGCRGWRGVPLKQFSAPLYWNIWRNPRKLLGGRCLTHIGTQGGTFIQSCCYTKRSMCPLTSERGHILFNLPCEH